MPRYQVERLVSTTRLELGLLCKCSLLSQISSLLVWLFVFGLLNGSPRIRASYVLLEQREIVLVLENPAHFNDNAFRIG